MKTKFSAKYFYKLKSFNYLDSKVQLSLTVHLFYTFLEFQELEKSHFKKYHKTNNKIYARYDEFVYDAESLRQFF